MKKLINYFLQGLLYIVPIAVTSYVAIWALKSIDSILPFQFPGLGIIVIVCIIILIGYLGSTIIKSPVNAFFQNYLKKRHY